MVGRSGFLTQDRVSRISGFRSLFVGMVPTSEQQWNSHEKSGEPNVDYHLEPCQRAIEMTRQQCCREKECRQASKRTISSACVGVFRRHPAQLRCPTEARNRAIILSRPFSTGMVELGKVDDPA